MAENSNQTSEPVWNDAYWAQVEAASSDVQAKTTERLAAADAAAPPRGLAANSYNFHPGDVPVTASLDPVGQPRQRRPSTREASIGIDEMVPQPESDTIVRIARVIGALPLVEQLSHMPPEQRG